MLSGRRDGPIVTLGGFGDLVREGVVKEDEGSERQGSRVDTVSLMDTQSQEPVPYVFQSNSSATFGRNSIGSAISDSNSKKRSLQDTGFEFDDDDGDAFPWDLSGQEADELEQRVSAPPETPRKAIKTGVYDTPATTGNRRPLPWMDNSSAKNTPNADHGLQTPSKTTTLPSLPTLSHSRLSENITHTTTPEPTPTPSRFKDALSNSPSSSNLTKEVFILLTTSSISLSTDTSASLRALLNKHELMTQGIIKGRDIVRLALKAKDAKVAELSARISALEAEREIDRARIRGLRF